MGKGALWIAIGCLLIVFCIVYLVFLSGTIVPGILGLIGGIGLVAYGIPSSVSGSGNETDVGKAPTSSHEQN